MEDLDAAITCHFEALNSRLPNHPGRPRILIDLADPLLARYERSGKRD